ncbi:MAG: O-antigen ligase family protein, partial [Pseudomonadota bacterium]
LVVEHLTGGQLKAFVANTTELTPREMTFNVVEDREVVEVLRTFLNGHSAALSILAFPIAACLSVWLGSGLRRTRIAMLTLSLAIGTLVMASDSETAKLAIVVSLGVFALSLISSKSVLYVLAAGWCTACLAMPFLVLATFPNEFGWQRHLPLSAYDRAEIWRYTVNKTWHSPIVGVGAQQTRYVSVSPVEHDSRTALTKRPPPHDGFVPVPRIAVHAHNVFIQTWFELGVLGAVLLTFLGLNALRGAQTLTSGILHFALATFASTAVVAGTGYRMWQMWLISSVLLTALVLFALSGRNVKRVNQEARIAGS